MILAAELRSRKVPKVPTGKGVIPEDGWYVIRPEQDDGVADIGYLYEGDEGYRQWMGPIKLPWPGSDEC